LNKLLWIFHRQHSEHHGVQRAKDGCVRPDAERQCQHSCGREARIFEEHAKAITKVIKHSDEWLVASGEFLPQAVQHPLKFFDLCQALLRFLLTAEVQV
jgi:hypothetical protein